MEKFARARRDKLVVQELPDELLIYDQERDKAHCLNRSAALIWKRCDGHRSIGEISRSVSAELKTTIDERAVWFALSQFAKDHLLEEKLTVPPGMMLAGMTMRGMNRRQMVQALGLAAVVAIPLVTSIVAPTPAQAATCLPSGATCTSAAQCCSGLCPSGTCS